MCNLAPEPGRCLGYHIRFYYDPSIGKCREFVYGGCEGNLNRFATREECSAKCYPTSELTTSNFYLQTKN